MGRIWGTIYRIRVEIVIVSSEYHIVDVVAVLYCICSLFARRRRCAVYILLLCSGYYTYCTHNILVCL